MAAWQAVSEGVAVTESSSGEVARRRRAPNHKRRRLRDIPELVIGTLLDIVVEDRELLALVAVAGYSVGIVALYNNAPIAALSLVAVIALVVAFVVASIWWDSSPKLPTSPRLLQSAALGTGVVVVTALLGLLPVVAAKLIFGM